MGDRFGVLAGAPRRLSAAVALSLVWSQLAIPSAQAAPKTSHARAEFDRGVKAYQREDFAAAAQAFSASYDAEADTETLFAWAQAERHLGRCDTAIELYDRLLDGLLPAANRTAVQKAKSECQVIVTSQHDAEQHGSDDSSRTGGSDAATAGSDAGEDAIVTVDDGSDAGPAVVRRIRREPRSWWQDPIGDMVTGAGVVGLLVGAVNFVEYRDKENALDAQPQPATETDAEFHQELSRAETDRDLAVGGVIVGGVLVGVGIGWYVLHARGDASRRASAVTGWVAPQGGGVTWVGSW